MDYCVRWVAKKDDCLNYTEPKEEYRFPEDSVIETPSITWKQMYDEIAKDLKMTWDMPIDYLSFPRRGLDVPVGEEHELSMSKTFYGIGESCMEGVKEGYNMPFDMETYKEMEEKIRKWGNENSMIDLSVLWDTADEEDVSLKFVTDGNFVGNLYRPGALEISEVIFNNPATVVYWKDGSKTVVTDMDNVVDGKAKPAESYSKETGLALCYMKKALGNKGNYNNAFRKWIKED